MKKYYKGIIAIVLFVIFFVLFSMIFFRLGEINFIPCETICDSPIPSRYLDSNSKCALFSLNDNIVRVKLGCYVEFKYFNSIFRERGIVFLVFSIILSLVLSYFISHYILKKIK